MLNRRSLSRLILALPALMFSFAAAAAESPLNAEKNPPGDIPDNQVFITYQSPLGYALKVPEGWARTESPDGVVFADKYGRIEAKVASGTLPSTTETVAALEASGRAIGVRRSATVTLPAGPALFVAFDSNSEPNPVTSKQIRLENDRYQFARDGKVVTLTFSAPKGADNADQWRLMSRSFSWH